MPLKYCPGTGSKPNKRTVKEEGRWTQSGYYRRVKQYKCPECQRHIGLDQHGVLCRHGHKITKEVVKERQRAKALKSGEFFSLCAECEGPVFEADYLCEDCRGC